MTEGKGGASGWSGRVEHQGELGQHPRPRAFSQSAVHTLEQRERDRDPEKVGSKSIIEIIEELCIVEYISPLTANF